MGRPVVLEHEFDNYADLIIPGKQTIRRCGVVDRVWLIAECAKWLHCCMQRKNIVLPSQTRPCALTCWIVWQYDDAMAALAEGYAHDSSEREIDY